MPIIRQAILRNVLNKCSVKREIANNSSAFARLCVFFQGRVYTLVQR